MFFFEKKNQKTFVSWSRLLQQAHPKIQKFFASFFQKRSSFLLLLAAILFIRHVPVDLSRAQNLSLEVDDHDGETLHAAISRDGKWRLPAAPQDVAPAYLAMLLRMEDNRFYRHPGIDPLALVRALGQLLTHGRIISGGSTITMQVARLLHPHRHTLLGKLRDMEVALRLEAQFSKSQILSLYLTLAPFGGNIEGVRAASLIYFGHGPATLSTQEAALLVALPQRPERRRPDRHPLAAEQAVQLVLARIGGPAAVWRAGTSHHMPALAPHLAERLRGMGLHGQVRTNLDARLQREMQELAAREAGTAGAGAEIAALIIRNSDRAVIGYLGGSNSGGHGGMVDMVRATRSPGSVLKPFIYGIAMDDGLIRPDTLIEDTKMRIADYAPEDFDRAFRGTVSAAEALQQSYNLPAVTLLDWLGPARTS
jgi:penicillin-binding protein 1C